MKSLGCIMGHHITKIISREGVAIFTFILYENGHLNAPLPVLSVIIKNKSVILNP